MEDTKIITMPLIALRGLTMLPEMTISFDISRKKSIAAVEKAMVTRESAWWHRRIRKSWIRLWTSFTTLARFLT